MKIKNIGTHICYQKHTMVTFWSIFCQCHDQYDPFGYYYVMKGFIEKKYYFSWYVHENTVGKRKKAGDLSQKNSFEGAKCLILSVPWLVLRTTINQNDQKWVFIEYEHIKKLLHTLGAKYGRSKKIAKNG